MDKIFNEALSKLDETSIFKYLEIVINNPLLEGYNHAFLFNQGNINNAVYPQKSIEALERMPTGECAEVCLPIYKDGFEFLKVKVQEVAARKKTPAKTNYYMKFVRMFGKEPTVIDIKDSSRLGFFDKEAGDVYISSFMEESNLKKLLNWAIVEIVIDILLANEDIENEDYRKLVLYTSLLNLGFHPNKPKVDFINLKAFLDERTLELISFFVKQCEYLTEGVSIDIEEVMILRYVMADNQEKTIENLEKLRGISSDPHISMMLKELIYKISAMDSSVYSNIYVLKKRKQLALHQGFKDTMDGNKYIKKLMDKEILND